MVNPGKNSKADIVSATVARFCASPQAYREREMSFARHMAEELAMLNSDACKESYSSYFSNFEDAVCRITYPEVAMFSEVDRAVKVFEDDSFSVEETNAAIAEIEKHKPHVESQIKRYYSDAVNVIAESAEAFCVKHAKLSDSFSELSDMSAETIFTFVWDFAEKTTVGKGLSDTMNRFDELLGLTGRIVTEVVGNMEAKYENDK